MKLPNAENVIIAEEKITRYLLCLEHPRGGSKARFFHLHGFRPRAWMMLANALRAHAADYDVTAVEDVDYGVDYVVEGPLATPNGKAPWVRVVWAILEGQDTPRLVTAYPCKRRIDT